MGEAVGGGGRRWPLYAGGAVIGAAAAVSGVLIAADHPSPHTHRHGPAFIILFAAIAAIVVGAMVVWSIRRRLNRPETKRLRAVSMSQRRAVLRAVKAGATLDEEQRSIARAQTEQLRSAATRMRWTMPMAAIAMVVLAIADTVGLRWVWAAIAAFELLSATAVRLLLGRQKRLLDRALTDPAAAG